MKRLTMALTSLRENSGRAIAIEAELGACRSTARVATSRSADCPPRRSNASAAHRRHASMICRRAHAQASQCSGTALLLAHLHSHHRLEAAVTLPHDLGAYLTGVSYRIPPQGISIR